MTLVRPSVFPDEVGDGFKGRLMRLNGITEERIVNQLLLRWAAPPGASLQEIPVVDLLAKAAGMSIVAFVRAHTMVPLRRAIVRAHFDYPHGHPASAGGVRQRSLRLCRTAAFLCEDCVREDFEFHGWVYWKREHQLPGLFWCRKHDSWLRYTNEPDALLRSPSDYLASGLRVKDPWARSAKKNDSIARFIAIESELLNQETPIDAGVASRRLSHLAATRGLHFGYGTLRRGQLLSDVLCESFGADWLSTVIPGADDKVAGQYWGPIDKAVSGHQWGLHCSVFIAALAVMFSDADDALAALLSTEAETSEEGAIDAELASVYRQWWEGRNEVEPSTDPQAPALSGESEDLTLLPESIPLSDRRQMLRRFVVEGKTLADACWDNSKLQKAAEALFRVTAAHFLGAMESFDDSGVPVRSRSKHQARASKEQATQATILGARRGRPARSG